MGGEGGGGGIKQYLCHFMLFLLRLLGVDLNFDLNNDIVLSSNRKGVF